MFNPFNLNASEQSKPYVDQGMSDYANKRYEQARDNLEIAVEIDPKDATAHFYLGLTYMSLNDYVKAASSLINARDLDPANRDVYFQLGIALYNIDSFDTAITALEKAKEFEPNNANIFFYLGLSFQKLDKNDESIASFKKAMELEKGLTAISLLYIGIAHVKALRYAQAKEVLNELLKTFPDTDEARNAKIYIETIEEQEKAALAKLQRRWSIRGSFGIEYSSNVTQSATEEVSKRADLSYVILAGGDYKLISTKEWDVTVGYDLYRTFYEDLTSFDLEGHMPFISLSRKIGKTELKFRYTFNFFDLENDALMRIGNFNPAISYSFTDSIITEVFYRLQLKDFHNLPTKNGNNHQTGFTQMLMFFGGRGYTIAGFTFENEDTNGIDQNYMAYKPSLSVRLPLILGLNLDLNWEYYKKNYRNEDLTDKVFRHDKKRTYGFKLSRTFFENFTLEMGINTMSTRSNIMSNSARENLYSVNLSARY